jgi:serine/threonine-protein kinase
MNETPFSESGDEYVPDKRLSGVYREANELDDNGLEALCPSYAELAETQERYRDETLIGEGALKEVYRAFDCRTQRWVAMARLRPDRGADFYDLFVHEAWLVASLSHPNIIKVHDTGVDEHGRPFFTMDLKSNTTLADLKEGALNDHLRTFIKVCDAMAYAHSRGVIHLDLKPENIQDDVYGEVLVCDWGLGKIIEEIGLEEDESACPVRSLDNMTLMGQIKGSLGYMAPEQVVPGSPKDPRTDVYALGCMLHFILTGQPPFTGSREQILADTAESKGVSPRLHYPNRYVPESLDAVVMKAMALDPADRYQSVGRLQQEIESYLAGFSTRAEQPGFFREAKLFIARNRVPTLITAAALLTLGMMGAFFAQHLGQQKIATEAERVRAEQLLDEVEMLDFEHATYVEQTQAAKQNLAISLARSARQLKNLAIFERPLETVRQGRQMVIAALQQDPDCADAHAQHLALDCVELNYKAALTRNPVVASTRQYENYIHLIRGFPSFDFSRHKRPDLNQLAGFLREARLVDGTQAANLERVLSYDYDARKNKDGYAPVVEAFLQYKYGGPEHLTLTFDADAATLSLWSDGLVSLVGQAGYGKCLLRFLSFRFLKLDIAGYFSLSDLDGLPIESLDLSRCQQVDLKNSVSLPQLKKMIVRPGQLAAATLREQIRTNDPFTIIEIPVDSGY